MRVSIVAGLIVAVHVAVIGSVVMTQGCTTTQRDAGRTEPLPVEPAPVPVLPPSAAVVVPEAVPPVAFPEIQPPVRPEPVKPGVAAENLYVVKAGDSLSKIAVRHGVNFRELAELNQITDPNKIRIGQKLILPDYAKPSQSQPAAKPAASAKPKAAAGEGGTYEVKAGDSLSKIAVAHKVALKDLAAANQITDYNKIRIGQKLVIPGAAKAEAPKAEAPKPEAPKAEAAEPEAAEAAAPAAVEAAPVPAPAPEAAAPETSDADQADMLEYTVQDGDTVDSIARLFVVRQDEIRRVNNLAPGQEVSPAQRIRIPPASSL
ncbi:MAG TPA: LysM peptidoglycan-binding domain-containing protein [Kiritimatiellia bacterium]|nr:LysM peptidoglycan-binding domain-containing protein [Kiritimatiellia bacterium]HPJ56279.1 LysM peptidoglycan-binding domain-containing protein [Kiritimatiellia bacterium]HPR68272.1 LysM peptidoglycan-binding domain-containing protein [Kiritimatiellia bacterium]HRX06058.1 LysM peptidoglycan-binding domain-containing protein [Kiritimatiellia bacterium]